MDFSLNSILWGGHKSKHPEWIRKEKDEMKILEFMYEYINKTITTLGGYPTSYVVVKEAVSDDD